MENVKPTISNGPRQMPVPKLSLAKLSDYLQKRFDGNGQKLFAMLQLVDPSANWNDQRMYRLLKGTSEFTASDLAAFKVAMSLDSIDDLYELPEEVD